MKNCHINFNNKKITKIRNDFTKKVQTNINLSNAQLYKMIQSLADSNLLIDGIIETVKHGRKKQEDGLLPGLLAPFAVLII